MSSVKELIDTDLDTDGTLAANSDSKIPTQKAVKTYIDAHKNATGTAVHGLGTICTQSSANVSITGGNIGITDLTLSGPNIYFKEPARQQARIQGGGSGSGSAILFHTHDGVESGVTMKLDNGNLYFGTYSAGTVSQTGYITIKDNAGNSRRLLVG